MAGIHKVITVRPQRWKLHVVTYSAVDELCKLFCKHSQDPEGFKRDAYDVVAHKGASTYWAGGLMAVLLPDEYEDVCVWHEALHVISSCWDMSGRPLKLPEDDEILTYGQQDLVVEIKQKVYGLPTSFFSKR